MSYNGSGLFQINSAGNPTVTGTTISSTWANALTADLATGLSTCITKDGQTTTSARISFLFGLSSTLTTDATSSTTGSIITSGGIGCAKALWVAGLANIAGAVTLQSTLQSTTYLATNSIIYLGGTTSSEVSIRRVGAEFYFKVGDDSAYARTISKDYISTDSIVFMGGVTSSEVSLRRNGVIMLSKLGDNSAFCEHQAAVFSANSSIIHLGDQSATAVSLRRSGTTLKVRKGNDSADASLTCADLTVSGTPNLNGVSGTFTTSIIVVNGVVTGGT